ncbi:MAG: hypothetical protein EZS28_000460 [Streblomastix strix]|uniref:Uncharacterized protein n=1 Tax=Streblomastix strix TaxID=222440 RepID=A0A5J4XA13_9EUKA|nr:MAG: hypothetical protein EZS28_000460 [Streblomastix strix]
MLDKKLNKSDQIDAYSKIEDDDLLLLKDDKTDLIDAYNKQEDDTLLLLKADKSELIDAYSKTEADALHVDKLNISDQIDVFSRTEDDALLLLMADKTQLIDSYTKQEEYALLLLKADKIQLIDSYTKGEDDALLMLKASQFTTYIKTETDYLIAQIDVGDFDLSGYMTVGTAQTIDAKKTFNNCCRFISSVDGMSTVIGSSFIKSDADNTVVLLGADGTKPISEFSSSIDDSNYMKKTEQELQLIHGILRKKTQDQPQPEPTDDDYITLRAVKSEFVSSIYNGSISGNLTATQFIKSDKDDTSVQLAGDGDRLSSDFSSGRATDEILTSQVTFNETQFVTPKFEGFVPNVNIKIGTLPEFYAPTVSELCMQVGSPYGERYPKPIGEIPQLVPIGVQILQQQMKNNDDIVSNSNEVFEPPVLNAITKLDLSSYFERKSFLASSGSVPQLIVYGDIITLTASYATISRFPNGNLFKSYTLEARLKAGDQLIVAPIKYCSRAQHYLLQIL